jgi:hypothetical protein
MRVFDDSRGHGRFLVRLALGLALLICPGCKKSAAEAGDGSADGTDSKREVGLPACPDPAAASALAAADDFGPNAKAMAMPSALGRINVYEVTAPNLLERIDIYVRADLAGSRVTLAVFRAASKDKAFEKVTDVQVDVPSCEGWASSGPLSVTLDPGRFYAVGFDPNQLITTFVNADTSNIPIDGHFGRLIGSKTVTSVSVPSVGWDKVADKDFMRQRLLTSPRMVDDAGISDDATDDAAAGDAPADADSAPVDTARDRSD